MSNKVESMLDEILYEDKGYQMRHERRPSESEQKIYEQVDSMTLEQIEKLQKKLDMRKERLEYLRENDKGKHNPSSW